MVNLFSKYILSDSCGAIILQDVVCENILENNNKRSKYSFNPHKIGIYCSPFTEEGNEAQGGYVIVQDFPANDWQSQDI